MPGNQRQKQPSFFDGLSENLYRILDKGKTVVCNQLEHCFVQKINALERVDPLQKKIKKASRLHNKDEATELKNEVRARTIFLLLGFFEPDILEHPFIKDYYPEKLRQKTNLNDFVMTMLVKPNELGLRDPRKLKVLTNFEVNALVRLMIMKYIETNKGALDVLVKHKHGFAHYEERDDKEVVISDLLTQEPKEKIVSNMKIFCSDMLKVAEFRAEYSMRGYTSRQMEKFGKRLMQAMGGAGMVVGAVLSGGALEVISAVAVAGITGSLFTGGILGLVALGVGAVVYMYFHKKAIKESRNLQKLHRHGDQIVKDRIDDVFSPNDSQLPPRFNISLFNDERKSDRDDLEMQDDLKEHVDLVDEPLLEKKYAQGEVDDPILVQGEVVDESGIVREKILQEHEDLDDQPGLALNERKEIKEHQDSNVNFDNQIPIVLSEFGQGLWQVAYGQKQEPEDMEATIHDTPITPDKVEGMARAFFAPGN